MLFLKGKNHKVYLLKIFSITTEITLDNVKLLNRAQNSDVWESVWFVNGSVTAKDRKGAYYKLELFDDFNKIVRK
jgi:hypothetical protein